MTIHLGKVTKTSEYQHIARACRRWSGTAVSLQYHHTSPDAPFRYGLTASRKVGGAVVRNRAKRRLREAVRLLAVEAQASGTALSGFDLVIVARTAATQLPFMTLCDELRRGLDHLRRPR